MSRLKMTGRRKISLMSLVFPFIVGCGGAGTTSLGSLFGGATTGAVTDPVTLASADILSSGIPALHNPEPATMLLLGTGIVALGLIRRKKI